MDREDDDGEMRLMIHEVLYSQPSVAEQEVK